MIDNNKDESEYAQEFAKIATKNKRSNKKTVENEKWWLCWKWSNPTKSSKQ